MYSWTVAFPILPGKTQLGTKEVPEHMRAHLDEYAESRSRAGVTMERVYLMPTPAGDFFVVYGEGKMPFGQVGQTWATSDLEIDRYFNERQAEITGIEIGKTPVPEPKLVWSYVEDTAPRGRGLAFVAPVPAGRTKDLVAFFQQAAAKRTELQESRRAVGITRDQAWITETPMGDFCCIYLEGADPVSGNEAWAHSTRPYDTWFKKEAGALFGIDFNQPLPPIEQIWDWPERGRQ